MSRKEEPSYFTYEYYDGYTKAEDVANRYAGDTDVTYYVVECHDPAFGEYTFLVTDNPCHVTNAPFSVFEVVYTANPPIDKDYRNTIAE